ncbi:cation efflux protein [Piedraia hortae CBS 480.64]|uniref:Cation efflux protein n=1 Tax=Piedraia hortae CBS 480.64 TaxID=1314780 RepID=A0A6A7BVF9_9PEZI|nr:cation efflux protein [Piedraia hortae CBS 480.64]
MAFSKSQRILLLLVINLIFFLVEIIVGYMVHSLALVADAFHMLNDVLSLAVGLWAVRIAGSTKNSKTFTYGWQRAETLGALVNGVFLVALCVTIFLDAMQRFFEPQEVSNPKLVLIVGCIGLTFNILGLFLFHDHSHGHGHDHGHSHSHDAVKNAEEGHHSHGPDAAVADESGNVADVLPQTRVAGLSKPAVEEERPTSARRKTRRTSALDEIYVNPNAFRQSIIEASRASFDDSEAVEATGEGQDANQGTRTDDPLLNKVGKKASYGTLQPVDHSSHQHTHPRPAAKGHGHSHGDLNMRGIFLHVMGDALGNLGVIATALIIWLCHGKWRFYFDPAVSLVITIIILTSAIPLCRAAARILLQAMPAGLSVDDIKDDIASLPGIISCHHLHVWQLSDSKLVASLHVQISFDFKGAGSARYMQLAHEIRKCLHEYGIHSSTIQPEFCLDPQHNHSQQQLQVDGPGDTETAPSSKTPSVCEGVCLLDCSDNCSKAGQTCCAPAGEP